MEVEEIDLSSLDIEDIDKKTPRSSLVLEVSPQDHSKNKKAISQLRRSGRKKIRPLQLIEKTVTLTRPRQLNINSTRKEIENYYLDKRIKLSSLSLETIFEEPKKDTIFMSNRKMKRSIHFGEVNGEKPDKSKVKKRRLKANKILKGSLKKFNKLSLDVLMCKLKDLDNVS